MKRIGLLIIIVFGLLKIVPAQKHLQILKQKLLAADSVVLISHKWPGPGYYSEKKRRWIKPEKLIAGSKANAKLIRERRLLSDTATKRLSKIIERPFSDRIIEIANCFIPHHAILIYKAGRIAYIDLCFGCHNVDLSQDIKFDEDFIDNRKWSELKAFFIQNDMKYHLGDQDDLDLEDEGDLED